MTKINKISISGLRGVRNKLDVELNGKSALFYGDNGTGKSTLSDVFEWFYYDKVKHLSGEDLGNKGYEALRNTSLSDEDNGILNLKYTDKDLDADRSIGIKNGKFVVNYSNCTEKFNNYIDDSTQEQLILRYNELVRFVLSSKTEKLKELSDIIGYSQLVNTKDILRKILNSLTREIKTKNFDDHVSQQQSQIIEQFDQNITKDEQFLEKVRDLVKPFSLDIKIENLEDVNEVRKRIKSPDDSKIIKQETFLTKIEEVLVNLPVNLDEIERLYIDYKTKFNDIISDIEKLKKLTIEKLLTAGQKLLSGEDYIDDTCPLCLEDANKQQLLTDINFRIEELKEIKSDQRELNESRSELKSQCESTLQILQVLSNDVQINEDDNAEIKSYIETILEGVRQYQEQLKIKVEDGSALVDEGDLKIERNTISSLNEDIISQLQGIRESREKDSKTDVYSKITLAGNSYAQIRHLNSEKQAYEIQRATLSVIYEQFVEKQKQSLEAFLDKFSSKIDEIYQFLNPGEKIENIQLIPSLSKEDELTGLKIQFDFFDEKAVIPPHKYLSESHLNCLGIGFFLASVEAFNNQNKFLILDDVISSFDSSHRKRFADLLAEKYGDFQIILLTHEKSWFEIVKNLVRGKNWIINTLKYSEEKGTYIDEAPQTLREIIENKIKDSDEKNLGNDARKYLEHILKQIAHNLEVKVSYRFNDVNENRMAFELLTELKGTIKKRKCSELERKEVINRLLGSLFIGNKDSHDNVNEPDFNDMKAFWKDVSDFEQLFFCKQCKTPLSLKYYDKVDKKIRCSKGDLSYSWKL